MLLHCIKREFAIEMMKKYKIKNIMSLKLRIDDSRRLVFDCKCISGDIVEDYKPRISENNDLHLDTGGQLSFNLGFDNEEYSINIIRIK